MRKKAIALIFAVIIAAASLAACGGYTPPPSKERIEGKNIDIFNNAKFNGINFSPEKLVLREDYSGYIVYVKQNTTVDAEKNNIGTALEEINTQALGEGDYQAGYRILYIREDGLKQRENGVEAKIEFTNISHTGSLSAKTLEEYLSEEDGQQKEINRNFLEAGSKKKSDITKIENKDGLHVAHFKGVTSNSEQHTLIIFEGCAVIAYYVENPLDLVEVDGDTIWSTTGEYYVLYKKQNFPVWTVVLAFVLLLALIVVSALRFGRNRSR
jgi:hypothetical protein